MTGHGSNSWFEEREKVMPMAVCRQCKKQYTIQDETRKHTCKSCGGTVAAVKNSGAAGAPTRPGLDLDGIACPRCQRFHPSLEARSCEECGAPLPRAAGLREKARKRTVQGDGGEKIAAREIRKILNLMTVIRYYYYAGAFVFSSHVLAIPILALKQGNPAVLKEFYSVISILSFLAAGLSLWGAWKVSTHPFFCSLLVALLVTVLTVPLYLDVLAKGLLGMSASSPGEMIRTVVLIFLFLMVSGLWGAVAAASRVRRLAAQYPNVRISRRMATKDGKLVRVEVSDEEAGKAMRRLRARSRIDRKQVLAFAGIAAGLAILVIVIWQMMKPPSIESRARELMNAWNSSTAAEEIILKVTAFFQAGSRERIRRQLEKKIERYGWEGNHPRLGEPRIDTYAQDNARADYPMSLAEGEGEFETFWIKDPSGHWYLRGLRIEDGLAPTP